MKILLMPAILTFLGSFIIPLLKGRVRKFYTIILPALIFIEVLFIKPGTTIKFKFLDFNIIPLYADKLSLVVAYIFLFIGIIAFIYSMHVKEIFHDMLGIWYLGAALGVVFAGDFLTLYVFWELLGLAPAGLVLLNNDTEARNAAFRYLVMHLLGGLFLLGGIWLNFLNTGSMVVTHFKVFNLAFVLMLVGVGVNTGFILIHTWLPDAYPKASYTASVFMSVYTTKTAVYLLARTLYGWQFVAYMGGAMAVFGVTMALMQNNARKLLSYHIISQVGYMVAVIGIGSGIGIYGGIFHLVNHILYKSLLFMTVGAVIYATGKENLSELGGLSKKLPIATTCAVIASLSISGVPFFNGFISKGVMFKAAHSYDIIYLLFELAAIGTFLSFLKFSYYGFIRPNKEIERTAKEIPLHMNIAMIATALSCFIIGIYPAIVINVLPFSSKIAFFSGEHLFGISQVMLVCFVAFILGRKKVFVPHDRLTFDFDVLYIRFINSLAIFPKLFSQANDFLESNLEKIPTLLSYTKKPILVTANYLSDLFFALWVDLWLYTPTTKLHADDVIDDTEKANLINTIIFKPSNSLIIFMDKLGAKIVRMVEFFEVNVDKAGENISNVFLQDFNARQNKISYFSRIFDKIIIDGFVNAVASMAFYLGKKARRVQTGLVQNYALIIVFVVAILVFALSIKGGLS